MHTYLLMNLSFFGQLGILFMDGLQLSYLRGMVFIYNFIGKFFVADSSMSFQFRALSWPFGAGTFGNDLFF